MSLEDIRYRYGVPAKRGGRVRYNRKLEGTITGSYGAHLRVRIDGDRFSMKYHPTWEMEYLDKEDA